MRVSRALAFGTINSYSYTKWKMHYLGHKVESGKEIQTQPYFFLHRSNLETEACD